MSPTISIALVDGADPSVPFPKFATPGAAGADLRANLPEDLRESGIEFDPLERRIVPSGLRMEVPKGFEIQIRSRSGIAFARGLAVANSPGTIDSDYRGEVGILLINLDSSPQTVSHGERIAQMVVARVEEARFERAVRLNPTARDKGGFGSTGTG